MENGEAATETTNYGNKVTCAVKYTNDGGTKVGKHTDKANFGAATAIAYISSATAYWWCSDGTMAKASTTAEDRVNTAFSISFGTEAINPNDTTAMGDPRIEYFLISCR